MAGTECQCDMQVVHYLRRRVNFNDAGVANGVLIGTLPAGAQITDVTVNITTAFNAATTNVVNVGTTTTGAEVAASAQVIAGTQGVKKPTAFYALGVMAADSDIWVSYTQTGAAATAGTGHVIVSYAPGGSISGTPTLARLTVPYTWTAITTGSGDSSIAWGVAGAPPGLSYDGSTHTLSGTPS